MNLKRQIRSQISLSEYPSFVLNVVYNDNYLFLIRYFLLNRKQEFRSSNPAMVTGIYDPNKS